MAKVTERKLVSFDWAVKKLLRSKANFDVLEGFLSELLLDDIKILEVLESESNRENENDKYNRVDIKVKNSKGPYRNRHRDQLNCHLPSRFQLLLDRHL